MPRPPDDSIVPLIMIKYTENFGQVDYSVGLNNAFEITQPLATFQQEAGAKGCVVIIQVSLVPADDYYGKLVAENEDNENDRPDPEP
jgi:hypothetical protein